MPRPSPQGLRRGLPCGPQSESELRVLWLHGQATCSSFQLTWGGLPAGDLQGRAGSGCAVFHLQGGLSTVLLCAVVNPCRLLHSQLVQCVSVLWVSVGLCFCFPRGRSCSPNYAWGQVEAIHAFPARGEPAASLCPCPGVRSQSLLRGVCMAAEEASCPVTNQSSVTERKHRGPASVCHDAVC